TVQALYIGGLHRAPVSPVWLGKIKCSLDGNPFLSLSYISPIAARKDIYVASDARPLALGA
ncbi:hypothetical protein, partial [Porphyromonas sp.]|uniref:hypothetical protein n=1 Tax=Porphyromonas sp. TaxID=1924944 RepID=UPI00257AB4E7